MSIFPHPKRLVGPAEYLADCIDVASVSGIWSVLNDLERHYRDEGEPVIGSLNSRPVRVYY